MMAGDTNFAVTVVIQSLAALVERDESLEDDFGFSRMWSTTAADLSAVDPNLRIKLRAMQITVLVKRGQNVQPMIEALDAPSLPMLGRAVGVLPLPLAGLAINLRLEESDSGEQISLAGSRQLRECAIAGRLVTTTISLSPRAISMGSPRITANLTRDIDSWLATISHYSPAQIEALERLRPDAARQRHDPVRRNLDAYLPEAGIRTRLGPSKRKARNKSGSRAARAIGLRLLEAAAIRTRIMVLAEWDEQLDVALALSESSLNHFDSDDCRFPIMEVTGRQLSYAHKPQDAMQWLDRALKCDAFQHSIWRRNVLITMAELYGAIAPSKAAEFTASAVQISQDGKLADTLYIESLAEHGIALWRAGESSKSFDASWNRPQIICLPLKVRQIRGRDYLLGFSSWSCISALWLSTGSHRKRTTNLSKAYFSLATNERTRATETSSWHTSVSASPCSLTAFAMSRRRQHGHGNR